MKKTLNKLLQFFCIFLAFNFVFSCKHKEEKLSAEQSYIKAYELLKDKNYSESVTEFDKLSDDFPFSKWAIKGQTMIAYASYKNDESEKVIQISEDFSQLHPNSEYLPYMIYMKALCYYDKIPSIDRSQDYTQKASYAFRELIARFPDDSHSEDAKEKLAVVDEHIAGAKMSIGRYQIKMKNYVGAIKNFQEVINRYRSTNQVPEAHYRIAEIYYKLGMKEQTLKKIDFLEKNFANNYWTKLAQKLTEKIHKTHSLKKLR